jgi:hypothetical protein
MSAGFHCEENEIRDVGSGIWDAKKREGIAIAHLTSRFAHLISLPVFRGKHFLLFTAVASSVKYPEPP